MNDYAQCFYMGMLLGLVEGATFTLIFGHGGAVVAFVIAGALVLCLVTVALGKKREGA